MENSVVAPNVDFTKVEAINQKRTLAFINHWVLHTVAFLNQFSTVCEERLITLTTKLRRADHTLAILEAKLRSVPGLEDVVAPAVEGNSQTATTSTAVQCNTDISQIPKSTTTTTTTTTTTNASTRENHDVVDVEQSSTTPTPEVITTPVSQDPKFARYFRMLKMGVPDPAVRIKMSSEGIDPSILDDPNAPAPTSTDANSDSSSVESWSD